MDTKEKSSTGSKDSPQKGIFAGPGPGAPDRGATPARDLPDPPSDEEVERIARKLGAPIHAREPESAER